MKKIYLLTLMPVLMCQASCTTALDTQAQPDQGTAVTFSIVDGDAYSVTKATGTINDAAVSNVQFFVFNADHTLNAYKKTTASSATFRVSNTGPLNCYALVNIDDNLSSIYTESDLLAKKSLLDSNQATKLHMFGSSASANISALTELSIPVTRFAAKVSIDAVEVDFASSALQSRSFKITGIYLINANSQCTFQDMAPDYRWKNRQKFVSGECTALLADTGLNISLTPTTPMNTPHTFYCYPNHNTSDAPFTRLVVETMLDDTKYYYPVNIYADSNKKLESNKHYHISKMTITGLGSSNPDVIPSLKNVKYSVEVKGWDVINLNDINY